MGKTITVERDQTNAPAGTEVTRDGIGVTGLTVLVRVYLGSDLTLFLDFNDGVFKAGGHTTTDLALAELGFGSYRRDGGINLSVVTIPAGDDHLLFVYDISVGGPGSDTDTVQLVDSFKSIPFDVWEEILTGAVHNVPTSAGRRLREIGFEIETGTAQAGAAQTITLEAAESSLDNFFDDREVGIVAGTGVGQVRTIRSYVGATRVATVNRPWQVVPDNTSEYVVGAQSGAGQFDVRQGWTRLRAGDLFRGIIHLEKNGIRRVLSGAATCTITAYNRAGGAAVLGPTAATLVTQDGQTWFSIEFSGFVPTAGEGLEIRATITDTDIGSTDGLTNVQFPDF